MGASLIICGSTSVSTERHRKGFGAPTHLSDEHFVETGGKIFHRTHPTSFHKRYRIERKLGQGSFATVYSVVDTKREFSEDDVVVRVSEKAGSDPRKELGILQKVSQIPYCVKLFDYFLEGGFAYLVIERCDMEMFEVLRSTTNLTERLFVPLAIDMLAGLAALHALRIIHRDVKPANFLFSMRSRILKLCDFGISECLTWKKPFATGLCGTAPFMSPEMLKHEPYGVQTDIWSLGVLLYAILLGAFPYMPAKKDGLAMRCMILVGLPVPSFGPVSGIESPSSSAIDLLHMLIERDPSTRATAKDALNHAWFNVSESSDHCSHTMMPAILSARNVGAFPFRSLAQLEGSDPRLAMFQQHPIRSKELLQKQNAGTSFASTAEGSQGSGSKDISPFVSSASSNNEICI